MPAYHRQLPPAEFLKEYIRYCPTSGNLYWRKRIQANVKADCRTPMSATNNTGYILVFLLGKPWTAGRIIWRMMTGEDPEELEVDHRNNVMTDNRWKNLRLATRSQNMRNARLSKTNKSGVKGVCWCKQSLRWRVDIRFNGKQKFMGMYSDIEDAKARIRELRPEKHQQFTNHG